MKPFMLGHSSDCSEEYFKGNAEAGIQCMEVSTTWERYPELDYAAIKKNAEKYGVELWSFHLPFCPFEVLDPASADKAVRDHTVEDFTKYIRIAADIGCKTIVVHPSGEPNPDPTRKAALNYAKDTFYRLAPIAEAAGVQLALENIPRTCLAKNSEEMLDLLSADSRLRSVFDTNHLLEEDPVHYIRAVGDKIISLHVSDYDFKNERHWLPGEGDNKWPEMIAALKEVGYCGPWLYELGYKAPVTIERRDLTAHDFRANYDALMRGETPAPIGKVYRDKCITWIEQQAIWDAEKK